MLFGNSYWHNLSLTVPILFSPLLSYRKTHSICFSRPRKHIATQQKILTYWLKRNPWIQILDFAQDFDPSFPSFTCSSNFCFLHSHLYTESPLFRLCGRFFHLLLHPPSHSLLKYFTNAGKAWGKEECNKVMKDMWKTTSGKIKRSIMADSAMWLSNRGPPNPTPWLQHAHGQCSSRL